MPYNKEIALITFNTAALMKKIITSLILLVSLNTFAQFNQCLDYFPNKQIPAVSQAGRDLCFDSFAILYSPSTKKPIYVVEKLNRERLQNKVDRKGVVRPIS